MSEAFIPGGRAPQSREIRLAAPARSPCASSPATAPVAFSECDVATSSPALPVTCEAGLRPARSAPLSARMGDAYPHRLSWPTLALYPPNATAIAAGLMTSAYWEMRFAAFPVDCVGIAASADRFDEAAIADVSTLCAPTRFYGGPPERMLDPT